MRSTTDLDSSIKLLEQLILLAPDYVEALSELGATLGLRYLLSTENQDIERAVACGRRALEKTHSSDDITMPHALYSLSSSIGSDSKAVALQMT
ncbi:uncharacterized protein BCR38DRAFT_152473 [Pseudomassariella vexata]|uniref:Uncharacterized protein n=1 Tax=Pseudomassariella vexata TaxID=1141098 RepID=A0A1Y2E765_9PEZI|nr:uncharacterized protein BCR38DRAFT_152473 [Pseudomassariella vexata]ORY67174.1 hypothetical protein BCR38DRAFT_152473 [Pseudomassariella vexata]